MTQQWKKSELDDWARGWTRTPQTVLKAFIDAGFCSDQEPSRSEMRLLRQSNASTVNATKPVISHPAEPAVGDAPVWYRGWECSYHTEAALWGCDGWVAYLGGPDLDCIQTSARTWEGLLDEIDDHDMTEKSA